MADYTNSKFPPGEVFPDGAVAQGWERTEPLITPLELREFHLWGLPLQSAIRNPITGKADILTDPTLQRYIERAVAIAELETGIDIFPTRYSEKHPYDKVEYESFGYFRVHHRPVASVDSMTVAPSSGQDVFTIPKEWIENGNLVKGQINIMPYTVNIMGTAVPATAGGAAFLMLMGQQPWIPAFWRIEYTTGFKDGKIPRVLNELIGTIAAIEVLSMLATTYSKSTSTSLSIDGLSQSIGTPGPELFKPRLEELKEKRQALVGKLKAMYGLKLFSGNV